MQDFRQFAGGFWWLVFPVLGMAGGAVKAWERGARARHGRRLEMLRAKHELRTLDAQARGIAPAAAPGSAAPHGLPDAARNDTARETKDARAKRLGRLMAEHDEITARWLDYELDAAKVIAFPAMTDVRQPLTSAYHRAKRRADDLRPDAPTARVSDVDFEAYREAVHEFAIAFETAEQEARRLRDSEFTPAERKRLDTAKQLLQVALDQSATRAERNISYRRAREELEGLIVLSDGAVNRLEERVALQLPAGERRLQEHPPAAGGDDRP